MPPPRPLSATLPSHSTKSSPTTAPANWHNAIPSLTYWDFSGFERARAERAPPAQDFSTSTGAAADTPTGPEAPPTAATTARIGDVDMLSDLPAWVLGFLVGCAVFISIVATVLFMAQFGTSVGWTRALGRLVRRRRWEAKYHAVEQEDYEMDDMGGADDGGRVVCRAARGGIGSVKNRKRKGRCMTGSLRVDTSGRYAGLGIAVPGHDAVAGAQEHGRSLDEHVLPHKSKTPGTARSVYFTAPLQSTAYFTADSRAHIAKPPRSAFEAGADMEACRLPFPEVSADLSDIFDFTSPLHGTVRDSGHEDGGAAGMVLWENINDGVGSAAGKMAKRFHNQVDAVAGPEEGLLLQVREQERERALEKGVFVE